MRKNKITETQVSKDHWYRFRALFALFILLIWFSALGGRLVQLSFFTDERVERYSKRQGAGDVKIHLPRGIIYDRNMNELAVSIKTHSVYLDPAKVKDIEKTVTALTKILEPSDVKARHKKEERLINTVQRKRNRRFVWVKRKIDPAHYTKIKAANLKGVGFVKESRRYYPKRDVAARIVGFCGIDNQGLHGLEVYYDDVIGPRTSKFNVLKDALGRPVSMPDAMTIAEESEPVDLVTTVDERIQYVAEKALERKVTQVGAKGGIAIVMESATGQVLAMAEQPKFNPNSYKKYKKGMYKSTSVTNAVEPGSTFKVFVTAAALEERLFKPYSVVNCENGKYRVAGHVFKEANYQRHKDLTVAEIIQKSSNIGAIKIAEALGEDRLMKYLKKFGFGSKSGVDLPGENSGLLQPVSAWSKTTLPSISFGQEVGVTPLQLIVGLNVFANDGYKVKPHFVKTLLRNEKPIPNQPVISATKVVSGATVAQIREMMTNVVKNGTGKRGAVPGFEVAGKTGTAQKIDPATRAYSKDKFLSSFFGFFPAENPKLTILVMIDEPVGLAWGGHIAGPVFAEIAARASRILRIPPSGSEVYEVDWRRIEEAASKSRGDYKTSGI